MTADNRIALCPMLEAPKDPQANGLLGGMLTRLRESLTTPDGMTNIDQYVQAGEEAGYRFRILQGVLINSRVTQDMVRDSLKIYPTYREETFDAAWGTVQGWVDQVTPKRTSRLQNITHFVAGSLGRLIRQSQTFFLP